MSLPLGALGGPLPLLVLDRHVGAVLHQSLDTEREKFTIAALRSETLKLVSPSRLRTQTSLSPLLLLLLVVLFLCRIMFPPQYRSTWLAEEKQLFSL